jgi:hypothetical protein
MTVAEDNHASAKGHQMLPQKVMYRGISSKGKFSIRACGNTTVMANNMARAPMSRCIAIKDRT